MVEDVEVGPQLAGIGKRWGFANSVPKQPGLLERLRRRCEARIDARDGTTVRLVLAMRRAVG